jgi:hypothetical protein
MWPVCGIRQFGCGTDCLDDPVAGKEPGVLQLAPLPVHRHQNVGVFREQRCHLSSHRHPTARKILRNDLSRMLTAPKNSADYFGSLSGQALTQ